MDGNLQIPGRWKIFFEHMLDIFKYGCWTITFIFLFSFVRLIDFKLLKTSWLIALNICVYALFIIGAVLVLLMLQTLIMLILDILTGECRVEKVKVLKFKEYSKGHRDWALYIIALLGNGQTEKLNSNYFDIKTGKYYNVAICRYSNRIIASEECEGDFGSSLQEREQHSHSVLFRLGELIGMVNECYTIKYNVFRSLAYMEMLIVLIAGACGVLLR